MDFVEKDAEKEYRSNVNNKPNEYTSFLESVLYEDDNMIENLNDEDSYIDVKEEKDIDYNRVIPKEEIDALFETNLVDVEGKRSRKQKMIQKMNNDFSGNQNFKSLMTEEQINILMIQIKAVKKKFFFINIKKFTIILACTIAHSN